MDEPICVPAEKEHPLLSETTCDFVERKETEVGYLGDAALVSTFSYVMQSCSVCLKSKLLLYRKSTIL